MYTNKNYKTKKELKEAVARGVKVTYHQPGVGDTPMNGTIYIEGPWYPEPHRWYAQCEVKDGVIVKVK
jgi:hypothetical protein